MRILLYAAGLHQWQPTNPDCLWRDIPSPAGTEIGIYGYCRALAHRGHQVTVVMPIDQEGVYDNVAYLKPPCAIPKGLYDVIISMHYADPLNDRYAPLQICLALSHHMVNIESVAPFVDRYMTPSHWGQRRLLASHPGLDKRRFWITRIGVWLQQFGWEKEDATGFLEGHPKEAWCWWSPYDRRDFKEVRDKKQLLWASSPDRGLWHMVDIMRLLGPEYKLTVAYDYDTFLARTDHLPTLLVLRKALPLKQMPNVEFVGHLSQPKLVERMQTAGFLVYPGDVEETYSVTTNQACAASLPAIVTGIGSFPENYGGAVVTMPPPVSPQQWAATIQLLVNDPHTYADIQVKERDLAQMTDFSEVAAEWEDLFSRFLKNPQDISPVDRGLAFRRGQ